MDILAFSIDVLSSIPRVSEVQSVILGCSFKASEIVPFIRLLTEVFQFNSIYSFKRRHLRIVQERLT